MAILLVVSVGAIAQPLATLTDLRKVTDQIMEQVGKGKLETGLKLLKPRTVVPEAEFSVMLSKAMLEVPPLTQRFGEPIGFEFIREDHVGENLIRYTYIHRYEKHAMRWLFFAYHGSNGWLINTFRFDDQFQLLFP